MDWRDDPVERHWERQIERAGSKRAADDEINRIRAEAKIRDAGRGVSRARSALERDAARRRIVDERHELARPLADCTWLDETVRERWKEWMYEIGDAGPASVVWLSDDIAEVCATVIRDLRAVAELLAPDVQRRSDDDGAPPLVAMHRVRRQVRSRAADARTRIGSCAYLTAAIRERWLRLLAEPDEGLGWLTSTGPGTAASLHREVMDLSDTVARFDSRMRGGLSIIERELEKLI